MNRDPSAVRTAAAIFMCAAAFVPTLAQSAEEPARSATVRLVSRDNVSKLNRCISVKLTDVRLEDALTWIREATGAKIDALWVDDRHTEGLDRGKAITVQVENETAMVLLERVLEAAQPDSGGEATWQVTAAGTLQVGPRARLNTYKQVRIYAIDDLIREVPRYAERPTIDLQQALQVGQGSGGSPFRAGNDGEERTREDNIRTKNTNDLVTLIRDMVETEQWTENGGSGGSIRLFQGALIVNAPDYMHRGIAGYMQTRIKAMQAGK